jgi:hypothetical protein
MLVDDQNTFILYDTLQLTDPLPTDYMRLYRVRGCKKG